MNTILQNLFNNGNNDGNFIMNTRNGTITCHPFVLYHISNVCKNLIDSNTLAININTDLKITKILINYMYTEKFSSEDLNINEITDLFDLIDNLKCDKCTTLKNYYLPKFLSKLDEDNWLNTLKIVFNCHNSLEEIIYKYFSDVILNNVSQINYIVSNSIVKNVSDQVQVRLFEIALSNIVNKVSEIDELKIERDNIMNKMLQSEVTSDEDIAPKIVKKKSKN